MHGCVCVRESDGNKREFNLAGDSESVHTCVFVSTYVHVHVVYVCVCLCLSVSSFVGFALQGL